MSGIVSVLLRTTASTIIAWCIASLLLRSQRISSTRVHQVAWLIVLAQGWAFVPLVLQLPVLKTAEETASQAEPAPQSWTVFTESSSETVDAPTAATVPMVESSTGTSWMMLPWLAGAFAVLSWNIFRYISLVRHLPMGREPAERCWRDEWEAALRESQFRGQSCFRVTDDIGPLCCFVPCFYLIAVPEGLWRLLGSQQRRAILRHELAHLVRGDLWKAVLVRILALPQWFNPLAWNAVRSFDEAAEWACDDEVMSTETERGTVAYSSALLKIAELRLPAVPGAVSAGGGQLSTRVRRLVQPRFKEETAMLKVSLPVLLVLVALGQCIRVELVASDELEAEVSPVVIAQDPNAGREAALPAGSAKPQAGETKQAEPAAYRVGSPDRLTVVARRVTEVGQPQSPSLTAECVVNHDGSIQFANHGSIVVDGMTTSEIEEIIRKKLDFGSRRYSVSVTVAQQNSKPFYIVIKSEKGDMVMRYPCLPDTTLATVLRKASYPYPIDFKRSGIRIHRQSGPHSITIDVDPAAINGSDASNPRLNPGDRVVIGTPHKALGASSAPMLPTATHKPLPVPVVSEGSQDADPMAAGYYSAESRDETPTDRIRRPHVPETGHSSLATIAPDKWIMLRFQLLELQRAKMRKIGLDFHRTPPFGFIKTLRAHDLVRTVVEPTVATASGRSAVFQTGSETPIVVPQPGGRVSVEYRRIGTRIECLPTVQSSGRIRLDIRTSIIDLHPKKTVKIGDETYPALRTREAESTVEVAAGETLVMSQIIGAGEDKPGNESKKGEADLILTATAEFISPLTR